MKHSRAADFLDSRSGRYWSGVFIRGASFTKKLLQLARDRPDVVLRPTGEYLRLENSEQGTRSLAKRLSVKRDSG